MLRNSFNKLVGIFVFAAAFAVAGPAGAVTGNVTMMSNDVAQTGGFTLELTDEATGESIGTFTDADGDGTVAVAVDDKDTKKCVVATIKDKDGKVIRRIPCFIIPLWGGFSLNVDITPGRVTTVSGGPPAVAQPRAPRAQQAPRDQTALGGPLILFDPYLSYTSYSGDGEVAHEFNGPERGSDTSHDASAGMRIRFYTPQIAGFSPFFMANGRTPPVTDGDTRLVRVRLHSLQGRLDTFYTVEAGGMLEAGGGVTFSNNTNGAPCGAPGTRSGCFSFSPWVSLAGMNVDSTFTTDETSGDGTNNRVSDTDTVLGFGIGGSLAFGVELANEMYIAPFIDVAWRFWEDPDGVSLTSNNNNFQYSTDADIDPEMEVRFGVSIPLNFLTSWFDRRFAPG